MLDPSLDTNSHRICAPTSIYVKQKNVLMLISERFAVTSLTENSATIRHECMWRNVEIKHQQEHLFDVNFCMSTRWSCDLKEKKKPSNAISLNTEYRMQYDQFVSKHKGSQ